jgi:hypothetical protein
MWPYQRDGEDRLPRTAAGAASGKLDDRKILDEMQSAFWSGVSVSKLTGNASLFMLSC